MKPTYQPNEYGLPAVLFTDDAERLSVDLRGNNTPRMVNTTVFLVIDISNLVNSGVVLQSVGSNQTTKTAGSIWLEMRKVQTLHLYQYPYQYHINDPTAGDAIKTTTTYTAHNTIMVIAFCVMEQTGSLTLSLYYHATSGPAVYTGTSPDIAQIAQEWITHLVIGAAGVNLHALRVHPGFMQTNDIAMTMTHLQNKWSTPEMFMPNRDLMWAWYDFADPTLMSSDQSRVSMGVIHNDNVQYVKDKLRNNRDMSNVIAHASYVDRGDPMAINNKGILQLQVGTSVTESLQYQLTNNPTNQMSRLLVFPT